MRKVLWGRGSLISGGVITWRFARPPSTAKSIQHVPGVEAVKLFAHGTNEVRKVLPPIAPGLQYACSFRSRHEQLAIGTLSIEHKEENIR